MHSPALAGIEVVRRGHVRRAKLYYLRSRRGKKARVRERSWWLEQELASGASPAESAAPAETGKAPAEGDAAVAEATVAEESAAGQPAEQD